MKIDAYLRRIAYTQTVAPNLETLCALQRAHLLCVPFENLDIGLKRPILLDQPSLWQKIVVNKRGGFCYELNGLFARLLQVVGFEVTCLDARDYDARTDSFGIDFDHLTLLVRVPNDATRWLVDVGYGDSFTQPMDVDNPNEQSDGRRGYWLEPFRAGYLLWQRKSDGTHEQQYFFDLTAHAFPSEYLATCHYHQTSPQSVFTQKRIITRLTEEGRISLDEKSLIITKHGIRHESVVAEDERAELLLKHFGVML